MNRDTHMRHARGSAGFSLIELMVALVISVLVLAAVSSVMVTSKQANTAQTAQARMQDNARIALQILSRGIRQSGYFGCSTGVGNSFQNHLNAGGPSVDLNIGLAGATGPGPSGTTTPTMQPQSDATSLPAVPTYASPDSDMVWVQYAAPDTSMTVQPPYMPQTSSALQVSAPNNLYPGEILMVTDCQAADVFQISNTNPSTSGTVDHNTGVGTPGNASQDLTHTYGAKSKISQFVSYLYYIRQPTSTDIPALYRESFNPVTGATTKEELVKGIDEMRILYGVDTNGDGAPNCYIPAGSSCGSGSGAINLTTAAGWAKVESVRIGILASTLANNTIASNESSASANTAQQDTRTYDILGDGIYQVNNGNESPIVNLGYQHQVFRTTVRVHNHP